MAHREAIRNWDDWTWKQRIEFYGAKLRDYCATDQARHFPPQALLDQWEAECDAHIAAERVRLETEAG